MSKKAFFIFILILLAIIFGVGWYFLMGDTPKVPEVTPLEPSDTDLFPFGNNQGTSTKNDTKTSRATSSEIVIDLSSKEELPRLRQISNEPVAGSAFRLASTTVLVRYINKATGHITEAALDSVASNKISNITIPQIAESFWGANASSTIIRYEKENAGIQSFSATINGQATGTKPAIEGVFLPTNIKTMSVLGSKVMYFDPTVENGKLILANLDGSKKTAVMNSDFGEWSFSWNNPKIAFLYTKPSGREEGFGYILDIASGSLSKAVGGFTGLEGTMSPHGQYVFLSSGDTSNISSAVYSVSKKTLETLPINTIASKCVWSNTKNTTIYCAVPVSVSQYTYPDDWYKGNLYFTDKMWKIDVLNGQTDLVFDPSQETLSSIDMKDLVIAGDDSYIVFTNKRDLTLWSYRLK